MITLIAAAILTGIVLLALLAPLKEKTKAAFALQVLVAGGALGLYLWQGHPSMPDQPIAPRIAARAEALAQVKDGMQKLQARLAQEPDDAQGWLLLAQSAAATGDHDLEKDALRHVLALLPDGAPIKSAIQSRLAQ